MLAREILKVLGKDISEREKASIITQLCKDEIYMQESSKNSKPVVNRFKFIQRELKKAKRPALQKVQRSERGEGLAWTDAAVLCTFSDSNFPEELIAQEDYEKLNVDKLLFSMVHRDDETCTTVNYKDIKARLAVLTTKKDKENDLIQIGASLFRTTSVEKIFKFYSMDTLDFYTKKNCITWGFCENFKFLIAPVLKR